MRAVEPISAASFDRGVVVNWVAAVPNRIAGKTVRERNGFGLMPELGYKPVNQYLPIREVKPIPIQNAAPPLTGGVKQFINRIINR